jgi:NADPH2:quinone reductase
MAILESVYMLQMHSQVQQDGTVTLSMRELETPVPGDDEVLVRMEAAPVNPSDLGMMFAGADLSKAQAHADSGLQAPLSPVALRAVSARVGQSLAVGNEGSGVVVAAGKSPLAQSLLGKMVAIRGGAMYATHRCIDAQGCLVMPQGTSAAACASSFVNPLTALGMVETMRLEGHAGLIHTAAASNLGQMLQKICTADGIPLVNVVRSGDQVGLMQGIGAEHVCDSTETDFAQALSSAIEKCNATVGFDATGGGRLASDILAAMEAALARAAPGFSRYGSSVHKQLYVYGSLEGGPTTLNRSYGMAWGVGGWLLTHFLERVGPERAQVLKQRVADEITTTFASHYTAVVSLAQALTLGALAQYGRRATGQKYLIDPQAD